MKITEINIGVTVKTRDYESLKLDFTAELDEDDSTTDVINSLYREIGQAVLRFEHMDKKAKAKYVLEDPKTFPEIQVLWAKQLLGIKDENQEAQKEEKPIS